jgi:REP element-mobilizing transposase RayT
MAFDPLVHRRRSIRLKGYNYAHSGCYFATLCSQGRSCLFGRIQDGEMKLSAAGECLYEWWVRLSGKFPGVDTDAFVVMPNHMHGIIVLEPSGDDLVRTERTTLGEVVAWFKTMTTNAYIRGVKEAGWPRFDGTLWQRNYYEHIVRNEHDLNAIREYIENNPMQWPLDHENPNRLP